MGQIKSVLRVFLSRIIGFLIFLILLALVNILAYYISNAIFIGIVGFLNSSVWLIILITIMMVVGEIFGALIFPFNLPSPLFNAVGAVFLIRFLFNLFQFIDNLMNLNLGFSYDYLYVLIAILVFIIVIIAGYLRIFFNLSLKRERKKEK